MPAPTPPPPHLRLAPLLGAALWAACLEAAPERVVQGVISDPQGRPIEGAFVVVEGRAARTDAQGAFSLGGLRADSRGPIHALAEGYTAWSLDRRALGRHEARLRPRAEAGPPQAPLNLSLRLPTPQALDRTVYVSLDGASIVEVVFGANAREALVSLSASQGRHSLSVISPSPTEGASEALWSPPVVLDVPPSGVSLDLTLQPYAAQELQARLLPMGPPSDLQRLALEVAATCTLDQRSGGLDVLVGRGGVVDASGVLSFQRFAVGGPCRLFVSYEVQTPSGVARHVAFAPLPQGAQGEPLRVRLPPTYPLVVSDEPGGVRWGEPSGATLYDAFLAHDGAQGVEPPFWSATTQAGSMRFPALPDEAWAALDHDPQAPLVARVVARFIPGFDVEAEAWDWTPYYASITTSWTPVSSDVVAR